MTDMNGQTPTTPAGGGQTPFRRTERVQVKTDRLVSDTALIGKRLGTYEITEILGKGGMGVVYKARDRSLDRPVAIKVLPPYLLQDPEFEKRFVREARAAAKVDHTHVVPVYAAGRFESYLCIIMQYVKGRTLAEEMKARGKFEWREALRVIYQASEALEAAHAMGLVHRDIKPNNILIEEETGRVKLMDFGLSRAISTHTELTQTGIYLGTPEYSSPEQWETSKGLDHRTDLYSLGVILYEMLCGRVPHVAETPLELFKKVMEEEPLPIEHLNPDVPQPVVRIVMKMLEKDREKRYPSATALKEDIQSLLEREKTTPLQKSWILITRKKLVAAAILLILTGVVLTLILLVVQKRLKKGESPTLGRADPHNPTKPVKTIPLKDRLHLIILDFENRSGEAHHLDCDHYKIMIPELLALSLSGNYSDFTDIPTRDEMLEKLNSGAGASVPPIKVLDRNQQTKLMALFTPQILISGWYSHVGRPEEGSLLVNLEIRCTYPTVSPKVITLHKREDEFHDLVDQLASNVVQFLRAERPRLNPTLSGLVARMPNMTKSMEQIQRQQEQIAAATKFVEETKQLEKEILEGDPKAAEKLTNLSARFAYEQSIQKSVLAKKLELERLRKAYQFKYALYKSDLAGDERAGEEQEFNRRLMQGDKRSIDELIQHVQQDHTESQPEKK